MVTTKNRVVLKLLPLLLVAGLTACTPPGARALLEGRRLLDAGDPTNAVARLQIATTLLPTNAVAWNYLGLASHRAGQVTNALQAYQKALVLDPDLYETRFNLGCLHFELNRLDLAKAAFTAYTLRRPNEANGWLRLGLTQLHTRDAAGADKSFREALRLSPHHPQALNGLGLVALQRNRPRDAVQFFTAAIQSQPIHRPALLNLAITLDHSLRDPVQAQQRYREYLTLMPRAADWESVSTRLRALEHEAARAATPPPQTTGTVAVVSPLPHAVPKPEPQPQPTPPAVTTITAASPKPTPPSPAQTVTVAPPTAVKPAISTSPPTEVTTSPTPSVPPQSLDVEVSTNPPPSSTQVDTPPEKRSFLSRVNPANLFKRDPKPELRPTPLPGDRTAPPSVVEVETAPPSPTPSPVTSPTSPVVTPTASKPIPRYSYHPTLKPVAGNRADAERAFAQGVKAQQAGKLDEAIQAYRTATQADPAFFEAHYNLGLAAGRAGRLSQSLAAYQQALAVRQDSVDARFNFALGLKQGGYLLDSASELERILAGHPEDTRARIALANLYAQQLGQTARAREHYRKVLDQEPRHPQADDIRHWLVQNPG